MYGHGRSADQFAKSNEERDETEEIITDLIKRGPAVGIIMVVATQNPDKDILPTGIRDNIGTRFAMRVFTHSPVTWCSVVACRCPATRRTRSPALTRAWATWSGRLTTSIPRSCTASTSTRRGRVVIGRARALRNDAGTLTGQAIGHTPVVRSSLLDDVHTAMSGDRMHCAPLAERLATLHPEQYGSWDATTLGSALRKQGVIVKTMTIARVGGVMGVRRAEIEKIRQARDTASD